MNFPLSNIERDTSIQCRASIDVATVDEYSERMGENDAFPQIVLFGTADKAWIGDGWHRIIAAEKIGFSDIPATLRPGVRMDALKYALGVNGEHGLRRSNADKRRCVEIALREFPGMSSRALSEMSGVSHVFVETVRGEVETVSSPTRTGKDGVERPASVRDVCGEAEREVSGGEVETPVVGTDAEAAKARAKDSWHEWLEHAGNIADAIGCMESLRLPKDRHGEAFQAGAQLVERLNAVIDKYMGEK
jgi:hypothetical protein